MAEPSPTPEAPPAAAAPDPRHVSFLLLSSLLVYLHYALYLGFAKIQGVHAACFALALALTGPLTILLPLTPLIALRRSSRPRVAFYLPAVLVFAAVHLFLIGDRFIYSMYAFHVNGFVWNLVTTRGGIDSLAASGSTHLVVAGLAILVVGLQAALIPLARRFPLRVTRRGVALGAAVLAVLLAAEKVDYGWSRFRFKSEILAVADAFPFYLRCDLSRPARALGFERGHRDPGLPAAKQGLLARYPRTELRRRPDAPLKHVVWLVSESWRADMLDPDIMPETWAFSARCSRFLSHYSGGNGTRTGVFSMFYGLPGPYWFPFIEEQRGPALMDFLLREKYDVRLFTSAAFTYPEFDRTVWARVPADRMVEATETLRWKRDREILEKLTARLKSVRKDQPSFTFQFFESPHAPYTFPPECAIRKPYAEDFNYVTTDYRRDIPLIRNRYINACRHLDTQVGLVVRTLEETGLLDQTILVLTGDHGEEFLEKGHWGHNSAFTEEQTRVPLVLWVPGRPAARIERLTSHLDLPATVLTLLGVETPSEEYSLGEDLLGPVARTHVILSDWNDVAFADAQGKIGVSLKNYDFAPKITTRQDAPMPDERGFLESRRGALLEMLRALGRFRQ